MANCDCSLFAEMSQPESYMFIQDLNVLSPNMERKKEACVLIS